MLNDRLSQIIDGGTVDLAVLKRRLIDVARPDSMIIWLYRDKVRDLLSGLATGTVPLTHDALDHYRARSVADHLRGLLTDVGLLPSRDRFLARFDRWVTERFPNTPTVATERLLRQFARWHQRPRLVEAAADGTSRESLLNNRCQEITVAAQFLTRLSEHNKTVDSLTQSDVDLWWATPPTSGHRARVFLGWLIATGTVSIVEVPGVPQGSTRPLSQPQRIEHLARMLDPSTGTRSARTAGMLLLLLAQPFHKIAAIRIDHIRMGHGETTITLGLDPTPIPEPFATLLRDHANNRPGLNTATNPTSPWLFPGRSPGNHLNETALRTSVRNLDIDLLAARTAALHYLVKQCPPAIVADMLGYNYGTVEDHANRSGATWTRYAALKSHPHGPPPTT